MFSTSGGWEFSSKRGGGVSGKKIKDGPREGGTKVRSKNITASGIFGRETALRAFYKLMGGRRI